MADKMILDFENEIIEWDTDNQKGTESYEGLKDMKAAVLKAIGYETIDLTGIVNSFNDFMNGKITEEELRKKMKEEEDK